jgi:adenylate cyclase class IV
MSRLSVGASGGIAAERDENMRNLEAKFRLIDHSVEYERALAIGFEPRGILIQHDTFFAAANGKLKLREQAGEAWLIHYRRDG